jgi:hypothetical protein
MVGTYDNCDDELWYALNMHLSDTGSEIGRDPDVIALAFQFREIFRIIVEKVGSIVLIQIRGDIFLNFSNYEG